MKTRKLVFAVTAMAVMGTNFAQAQTITKANNATALNAGGSWVGGFAPASGETALWDSTVTGVNSPVLGGNVTWGQIQITNPGGAVTIANTANATNTLNGIGGIGIDMSVATQDLTIANLMTLGGAQTWTVGSGRTLTIPVNYIVNNGGYLLTIDGSGTTSWGTINQTPATLTGAGGLTKNGSGRFSFSGNNTGYSGTTTLNGGVTIVNSVGSIGSGNLTLNGGVIEHYWTETFIRGLGNGAGQVQLIGGVSGFSENGSTGMTIKLGNGTATVVWGALGEGTATGFLNPSTLVLEAASAQSGSTLDFQNGINLNGATRTISVLKNSNLASGATISGAIIGTGASGLIKEGVGHLALTASNTYAGGTTISNGTLRFNTRASMPAVGTVTVANGATLEVTVAGSGTTWTNGTGVAGIAGLTSTANSGEGYGSQTGAVVNFDGNSILNLNVTGNVTESNAIGDGTATSIRLIKSGGSTLTLTGNNSYSGGTTLSAGTLSVGSDTAIPSTGTIRLNGGTIQSSGATARTFSNPVTIGGDFTVGGSGNLTFSNTGASALGATRTITITTSTVNATFAQAFSGSTFGITKAGAGTLTLTGNNTYTGITTLNGGPIVLNNDGDVTGSTVSLTGGSLTITGGSGVNSTWNCGNQDFTASGNNLQMLIDGKGFAGSAVMTNVKILAWGRTATSSTILLTDGGQMNVNGEIRIGNPYYSEAGGANVTIGGGTATSTFTGNAGQDFYIGYGERTGSKNNIVTVSSNGVLTNVRDMYVGHVFDAQNNANPSMNNQLLVTGTGTASMRGISLGYANASSSRTANANIVSVTSGGTLTSSGSILIGRANQTGSQANSNTATVTGTGSSWNVGNQPVYVGNAVAGAVSTGNVLTASSGGVATNISALIVKAANTLSLGAGGLIAATAVTNAGTLAVTIDGSSTPACGRLAVTGNLNLNNATLAVTLGTTATDPCVIATYGSLTGGFSVTNGLSDKYRLDMNYKSENKIAIIYTAAGTLIQLK